MNFAEMLANEQAARSEYDITFREMHDAPNDPGTVEFRTWMITMELSTIVRQQQQDHEIDDARALRPCPCDCFCDCLEWSRDQGKHITLVSDLSESQSKELHLFGHKMR